MSWAVRAYRPGDEAAVVELWNGSLYADPIDETVFAARVLADPNFERAHLLVAEPAGGGAPAGFLLCVARSVPLMAGEGLEPEAAWITAFGVRPEARRRGAGTALLEAACGGLAARGCGTVEVSTYAPGYFWPGVDRDAYPTALAFLEARGFRRSYEAVAMERSLSAYAVPDEALRARRRLEGEGVAFTPLSPPYVLPLIEWNRAVFHADWARAVRDAVARRLPWSRTLLAVEHGGMTPRVASMSAPEAPTAPAAERAGRPPAAPAPGTATVRSPQAPIPVAASPGPSAAPSPVPSLVAPALPLPRILGFAQYGCYDAAADRFGPFGVDPSARRRGIGGVLLHATLRAMQCDGLKCAWFLWTGEDSPAGALYRRTGFQVSRRFVILRRRLGGGAARETG